MVKETARAASLPCTFMSLASLSSARSWVFNDIGRNKDITEGQNADTLTLLGERLPHAEQSSRAVETTLCVGRNARGTATELAKMIAAIQSQETPKNTTKEMP